MFPWQTEKTNEKGKQVFEKRIDKHQKSKFYIFSQKKKIENEYQLKLEGCFFIIFVFCQNNNFFFCEKYRNLTSEFRSICSKKLFEKKKTSYLTYSNTKAALLRGSLAAGICQLFVYNENYFLFDIFSDFLTKNIPTPKLHC